MPTDLKSLLRRMWWTYHPAAEWPEQVYRGFNLVEGCAWLVIAALVLWRYRRFRRSPLELVYAIAFVTFGLSDFWEAYELTSALITFKGANLIVLLLLRRAILRRYYPQSRTF